MEVKMCVVLRVLLVSRRVVNYSLIPCFGIHNEHSWLVHQRTDKTKLHASQFSTPKIGKYQTVIKIN